MAMGGGVSLGTFSGGALTQTIKLLFVNNLINKLEGKAYYDKIVIDAFSGASAGALALALMLRTMSFPDQEVITPASERNSQLEAKLRREFGDGFQPIWDEASDQERMQLVLIQHVQDLQEKAWVKDVNLERLLRADKNSEDRSRFEHEPSLLYLKTYENIAASFIDTPNRSLFFHTAPNPTGLLHSNVQFACSLSRLNPITADGRSQYQERMDDPGLIGLNDALRSVVHRDMRVFDIHFTDVGRNMGSLPLRWYRFHTGVANTNSDSHILENIRQRSSWQTITATAIACGCFPIAFKPVLLERHRCEFGKDFWPSQIEDLYAQTGESDDFKKDRYAFSYVDGGVFNNEPLREAFRLAYYQDMRSNEADYDRRVLFVDPIVSDEVQSLGLNIHNRFRWDGERNRFKKKGTAFGLFDMVFTMGNAIKNQARVNEGDKVFAKRDEFKLRESYRKHFVNMPVGTVADPVTLRRLAKECDENLEKKRQTDKLASVQTDLASELKRVILENRNVYYQYLGRIHEFISWYKSDATDWPFGNDAAADWYKLLMLSKLDIMMDMEGVDNRASLISISPHKVTANSRSDSNDITYQFEKIKLKGDPVFGFAGFMHKGARKADFETGKWAAFHFLSFYEGFHAKQPLFVQLGKQPEFNIDFTESTKQTSKHLWRRVDTTIKQLISDIAWDTGWWGYQFLMLIKRLNFIKEAKIRDILTSQFNQDDFKKLGLVITGSTQPFTLVSGTREWENELKKLPVDDDLKKRLLRGLGRRKSKNIRSSFELANNHNRTSDERHTVFLEVAYEVSAIDQVLWKSDYITHRYILIKIDSTFRTYSFLVELPDAETLRKHQLTFNPMWSLDLRSFEQQNTSQLIDASAWKPALHLHPSDDKRVFLE